MKSILVHIQEDDGLEARLQVTLDLSRAFDAHITCLQAVSYETSMPGEFYGSMFTHMLPVMREHADKLRKQTEAGLAREGVSWDWVEEIGPPESCLLQHAALNDIVVIGSQVPEGRKGSPSRIAGALAIHSRTPLIVVPENCRGFDPSGTAMVCWNSSIEASNALRASLDFLRKADKVELVSIASKKEDSTLLPPMQGVEYLARHGVRASVVQIPDDGSNVADALTKAAQVRKADYLVMGAYGRSRLLEGVFGGVTHRLLSNPEFPLLLAH